jgi:osmoprotectant transport system permease protein
MKTILIMVIFWGLFSPALKASDEMREIRVGSKKFTESVILGELATLLIKTEHPDVKHLQELGGTRILWNALIQGDIHLYPEYTGTIIQEIFADRSISDKNELPAILAQYNIGMSKPLGFNNTYALGMKRRLAEKLHIRTISDLRSHPELVLGFTNEFMDRRDGWPTLQKYYQLPQKNVRGLDHDLAYHGIESGAIDVIDLYSTDAEIKYYDLVALTDDGHFFTDYQAVYLYRQELINRAPGALNRVLKLEGMISESQMIQMNALVKIQGQSESRVAADFIRKNFYLEVNVSQSGWLDRLEQRTVQHLFLVAISLMAAILISIPLGIISFRYFKVGQLILGVVGIIQTIPSLALIVFMIPLLGIGTKPALLALFLYSLLPIVRNTHSGLSDISRPVRESAKALGLTRFAQLRLIELPLAFRSILSGIKISAVINVGTATLGALIGAGGYGQPILTGIRLDNLGLILEGAIPAALLALLVQYFFDILEKILVPRPLRQGA